jgi:hypothetical protein
VIGVKRTLVSVVVSLVLVITAVASVLLMASAGVFTGAEQPLPSAPERDAATVQDANANSAALAAGFQAAQPRDPFEPLIDPPPPDPTDTTTGDDATSTTAGDGSSTTTTAGDGSSTTSSSSATTTTVGDDPDGTRVALLEVREESGALVAVVEVDGVTYTVGVGETFADNFKVVSLTESGGVFTYGDSAFTLAVGQSILK